MSATSSGRFSIVPTIAVEDRQISAPAFRTLALLGTYANKTGRCWPAYRTLAQRLGVSRSTVIGHVGLLAKLGYLKIERRKRENGSDSTNVLTLLFDRPVITNDLGSNQPTPGVESADPTAKSGEGGGVSISGRVEPFNSPGQQLSDPQNVPIEHSSSPSEMMIPDARPKPPNVKPPNKTKLKSLATPITVMALPDAWRAYATEKGHPDADTEFENFRDCWLERQHTQKGCKSDWDAAWRRWVRNSFEFAAKRDERNRQRSPHGTLFDAAARAARSPRGSN